MQEGLGKRQAGQVGKKQEDWGKGLWDGGKIKVGCIYDKRGGEKVPRGCERVK